MKHGLLQMEKLQVSIEARGRSVEPNRATQGAGSARTLLEQSSPIMFGGPNHILGVGAAYMQHVICMSV